MPLVFGVHATKHIYLIYNTFKICTNNFNYDVSLITLLKLLKWMNIQTRFIYFTGIFMFKFVNNLLPPTFDYKFSFVKVVHNYATRAYSAEDITLPK